MKQIKSTYNSNTQEIFGKITLGGKSIFNRSSYILVSNDVTAKKGYKAVISAAKLAACNHHDLQIDVPIFSDIVAEHNHIVRAKTFYKTIQGLYNLALFGQQIGLRIVIHKQTYKRLPQMADYIYHNFPFVTQVAFIQMETTGLAQTNLNDLWIDPHDYNEELYKAVMLLHNRGITTYIYNAQLCVLPAELRPFAKQSISEWKDVYLPVCEGCSLKGECGGFFSTNNDNISKYIHKVECIDSCAE